MRTRLLFGLTLLVTCLTLGGFDLSLVNASLWQPSNMPIVFVDPPMVATSVGENFTIYVKFFNLSDNFYLADEQWQPGEPLPPPYQDGRCYNYSLGGLYGLYLQLSWDPSLLEYVNHTVMITSDDYPDGILYELCSWGDAVDQSLGTYWVVAQEATLTPVFNCPNENATVFCMTFRGKTEGICTFNITEIDLTIPLARPEFQDASAAIPIWVLHGQCDVIPELHLLMLPSFLISTLITVFLKKKLHLMKRDPSD